LLSNQILARRRVQISEREFVVLAQTITEDLNSGYESLTVTEAVDLLPHSLSHVSD
jgi:hypothetical protein